MQLTQILPNLACVCEFGVVNGSKSECNKANSRCSHSRLAMFDEAFDAVASVGHIRLPTESNYHSRQHSALTTYKNT